MAGCEADTGFEIVLRLSPQLLMQAQFAERKQQSGFLLVQTEPLLGLLDLCQQVTGSALAVKCDQFAVPLRIQAAGEQLFREGAAAMLYQRARGGSGKPAAPLDIGRDVFQAGGQTGQILLLTDFFQPCFLAIAPPPAHRWMRAFPADRASAA